MSDLNQYIESDAVDHIILSSQISLMLAKNKGLVIDSDNGKRILLKFSDQNGSAGYEQRTYLFASQVMN